MHVPAPSSHPEIVVSYFLKQLSSASNYLIYIKLDEAIKIISFNYASVCEWTKKALAM